MPIASEIDSHAGLIITRVTGRPEQVEFREHQKRLAADPAFDPSYDHLFDLSDIESLDVDPPEIRSFAEETIFDPGSRRAVIAPRNHHYGLSRMYQALHKDEEHVAVFRSRSEALEWLGRPPDAPADDTGDGPV